MARRPLAFASATLVAVGLVPTVDGCTFLVSFDEVDSGIGGAVAEVVGQKLRALGRERQVLCVTHLPQVAAQGHQHLNVRKDTDAEGTASAVATLDARQRIEELARMLGGVEITRETRAHARQMLAAASRDEGEKRERGL